MSEQCDFPRLVVCAAIRHPLTGEVVCGPRHGDCLNAAVGVFIPEGRRWELGFVDQHNVFMDRTEAWFVADAAGQIRRPTGYERNYDNQRPPGVGDSGLLFSENLY